MFPDAPVHEPPLAVVHVEHAQIAGLGVVRPGQVGRPADGFRQHRVHDLKHHFRAFPRRHAGRAFGNLLLQRLDGRGQLLGRLAGEGAVDLGLLAVGERGEPFLPGEPLVGGPAAGLFPGRLDVLGDLERGRGPAIGLTRGVDLVRVGQGAVALGRVLRRVPQGDVRLARDHRRLARLLGRHDGGVDGLGIVAVDLLHMPAGGLEAHRLIRAVGQVHRAVDGDAVVVPEHDQLAQLVPPGQRDRLLADALHQATVAGDDIGVMVDHLLAEAGAQHLLGHGKAHGIGQPLAQRTGRRLDRLGEEVFGVPRRARAQLTEVAQLLDGKLLVAGQVQQGIEQHRPVARRQDEPVAVDPGRGGGVELQMLGEQDGGHVGHPHGHSGVAGIGGCDGIQRQNPDRGGHVPVVGMRVAQGGDVHCVVLRAADGAMARS